MNKYLPSGAILAVCVLGFVYGVIEFSLIPIVVFGVAGFFAGKKVLEIAKASKTE